MGETMDSTSKPGPKLSCQILGFRFPMKEKESEMGEPHYRSSPGPRHPLEVCCPGALSSLCGPAWDWETSLLAVSC